MAMNACPRASLSMIRICVLLVSTALFSLCGRAQIGAPVIDEFGRAQFAAQGLGWSAAQLSDGRLVFGFDTITIFDGIRWKAHQVSKAYALRALDTTPEGGIWVGGVNEIGFLEPHGGGFNYHSLVDRLPPELQGRIGDVWHVFAEGPAQAVFVSTEYILRWNGSRFSVFHLPGAPRLAAFRADGRILIGHRPTGLRAVGKEGLETVLSVEQLQGAGVVWSGLVGGQQLFATTSGLRVLKDNVLLPFAPSLDSWTRESVLTCAIGLRDGGIALGTLKGGVTVVNVDGSVMRRLHLDEEFPTEAVNALFEDKEGWLWIISPARLLRILSNRAVSIFHPPRAAAFPPHAIAPFRDGAIVASETGLWHTLDVPGPDGKRLANLRGLHERMLGLLQDGGDVVVAHRGGVSIVQPDGTVKLVHTFPSDVFALTRDPQGRLLAALNHRVLQLNRDEVVELPGVLPDIPTSLAALSSGALIAGTWAEGVASIGPSDAGATNVSAALATESGPAFVALSDGVLFATRGSKIATIVQPDTKCVTFTLPQGFQPKAIAKRSRFEAWVGGEREFSDGVRLPIIYQLRLDRDRIEATPLRLDSLTRIGSLSSLAVQGTTNGPVLWIGGDSALLRVVPAELPPWSVPTAPNLRLVSETQFEGTQLILPHQRNRLDIDIFSPEPDRRIGLRLQTMIEGTDDTWSDPHDRYIVALANLQSGTYRVRARLIAPDGSMSAISEFPVTVALPWWFTPWAIAAQILFVSLFVFGIVRLRLRELRRRATQLEHLVAERTAQLTHASQAKSEFVSNMSHELRNPLNGIVASAHALDESGLAADQRSLLATVRHCAGLLDALVGDVLDMAEIESGTIRLRNRNYRPIEVATAAADIVRPIAERKGLGITLSIGESIPESAHGDAYRVQQVLLNLLGNAVKFSDRGEIRLTLRASSPPKGSPVLEFRVEDEGPGISREDRPQLFEKFSRLPSARERGIPGTGLGLALCRQLVDRMGGRIWISDTDSSGATFCFQVPVQTADANGELSQATESFTAPQSALVIEDLDYNANAMVAILKMMHCRAEIAPTAAIALEKLRQTPFDVIFLDCDLPDMPGPVLARAILADHEASAHKPVMIATTATADNATRERCHKAGMAAFIAKPVTPEKIRTALGSVAPAVRLPVPQPTRVTSLEPSGLNLSQLRLLGEKPDELRANAQRLSEMLSADMLLLRSSSQKRDFATARSTAHRIVSHAKFIGAKSLATVAGEIERTSSEEPDAVVELLAAAESHARTLISKLDFPKG